ncbi:unnamed protein product [Rhizophagus irregularis]|nr:unnamed protein product [Rhizophagus irregularis]
MILKITQISCIYIQNQLLVNPKTTTHFMNCGFQSTREEHHDFKTNMKLMGATKFTLSYNPDAHNPDKS